MGGPLPGSQPVGPHVPASWGDTAVGTRTEHSAGAAESWDDLALLALLSCATSARTDPPHAAASSAGTSIEHPHSRSAARSSLEAAELPAGPGGPGNEPARRRGVTLRSCSPTAAGRAAAQGDTGTGAVEPLAHSLSPHAALGHVSPMPLPEPTFLFSPQIYSNALL